MATLIRVDQAYEIPDQLPVVALRDLVFFPYMVLPLLIGRPPSVAALEVAEKGDGYILLLAQKDVQVEEPSKDDVHRVGGGRAGATGITSSGRKRTRRARGHRTLSRSSFPEVRGEFDGIDRAVRHGGTCGGTRAE